jgi:hypothetical protein
MCGLAIAKGQTTHRMHMPPKKGEIILRELCDARYLRDSPGNDDIAGEARCQAYSFGSGGLVVLTETGVLGCGV